MAVLNMAGGKRRLLAGAALASLWSMPAHADTLREALAEAYINNPTLLSARAQQRAVDENVPIEKAAGRPSVTADAQYIEFVQDKPARVNGPDRTLGAGIDLGVPVYSGGAVKNSVRAAEERVQAGQADLRGTESAIFSRVVAAYMDVLRFEAIYELSANQVDVLGVNLQATSDRFEIGILTRTDVAQSQARLALAQSDLRAAAANLIAARETYVQLVGEAPQDLQPPPPLPNLPDSVGVAVATALENNPDLIAERERAQAAGYDIEVAGASRLPRVSVFTGGSYANYLGSLDGSTGVILDPTDPVPSPVQPTIGQTTTSVQVGVQLSLPLFQGGRPAALRRQAQQRALSQYEFVTAVERDVIAQVRSAWANLAAANAIIESSQEAIAAAELSLEGVRAENSIGNRTILDVLNAEQELLVARVDLVTARRNAYVAGFTLLAAMGLAEARDLSLDVTGPLYDPTINYERVRGKFFDFDDDPAPVPQASRTVDVPPADILIGPVDDEFYGANDE